MCDPLERTKQGNWQVVRHVLPDPIPADIPQESQEDPDGAPDPHLHGPPPYQRPQLPQARDVPAPRTVSRPSVGFLGPIQRGTAWHPPCAPAAALPRERRNDGSGHRSEQPLAIAPGPRAPVASGPEGAAASCNPDWPAAPNSLAPKDCGDRASEECRPAPGEPPSHSTPASGRQGRGGESCLNVCNQDESRGPRH